MNSSDFTPQHLAFIAEMDGWIEIYRPEVFEFRYRNTKTDTGSNELPDYPNSRDASDAVWRKLSAEDQKKAYDFLVKITLRDLKRALHGLSIYQACVLATPTQMCEALLRVKGQIV